ncbi:MAG: hypothetical protein PQJ61_12725 [Spirochaetales bacterium]|uniref:Lipoprotein n=1 Tax=Candidatus Thalassospirochaeta sargassi TaxID=3119039 RepID=A0AAJ1IIA4_9SPIO|nr:hypothetical protein [Spirochaetales bacterium]
MSKKLKLIVSVIIFNLVLFSCASEDNAADSRPGNKAPARDRGQEQSMPQPSEDVLTLVKLKSLSGDVQGNDIEVLSRRQAGAIIPILKEWLAAVENDPKTDSQKFVKRISAELTEGQNKYIPRPPMGDRPPEGEKPPEGGRPGEMSVADMLPEVIEALSKI